MPPDSISGRLTMDLSDIKIAICAIIILIGTLTIAGLAGFDMGRKVE